MRVSLLQSRKVTDPDLDIPRSEEAGRHSLGNVTCITKEKGKDRSKETRRPGRSDSQLSTSGALPSADRVPGTCCRGACVCVVVKLGEQSYMSVRMCASDVQRHTWEQ